MTISVEAWYFITFFTFLPSQVGATLGGACFF